MKKSAYQKLKERNEGLKADIYKLIVKPDDLETQALHMAYKLTFEMHNAVMNASIEMCKDSYMVGLKSAIQE